MTPEVTQILLGIITGIVGMFIGQRALLPRMVEARMKQAEERFKSQLADVEANRKQTEDRLKSQLADAQANRELMTLERGSPYKINELLTEALIRFTDTGERTALAVERLVTDNQRTTAQIIEQSKIASTTIAEQGAATDIVVGKNTQALAENTASMTSLDTSFQKEFSDFLIKGSIPTQKIGVIIEDIVKTLGGIESILKLFEPYIYSIPANQAIIDKFRNIRALTQQLVEQAALETVPPENKAESIELTDKIVADMSNPPVSPAAEAPDSLAAAPP